MPECMTNEPVPGRPRYRLAWCALCSDGFRGLRATVEKWAAKHVETEHGGDA